MRLVFKFSQHLGWGSRPFGGNWIFVHKARVDGWLLTVDWLITDLIRCGQIWTDQLINSLAGGARVYHYDHEYTMGWEGVFHLLTVYGRFLFLWYDMFWSSMHGVMLSMGMAQYRCGCDQKKWFGCVIISCWIVSGVSGSLIILDWTGLD